MLVALFFTAVRVKGVGVGKCALIPVSDKTRNHYIVTGAKLNTVEFRVLLTNAVQVDESVHSHELIDRIGDLATVRLEALKQR